MAGNLSHQYLKAMGINRWQLRRTQTGDELTHSDSLSSERVSHEPVNPDSATALTANAAPSQKPIPAHQLNIAQQTMISLDETLRTCKVIVANCPAGGKMLLLLERELTSPAEDLLSAMLKAINVDRLSQCVATLSSSADGESIDAVCERVAPEIVLVMSVLTNSADIAELDAHRTAFQHFSWLKLPVAFTLHPQVLLENPQAKRSAWEDLKRVKAFLDG